MGRYNDREDVDMQIVPSFLVPPSWRAAFVHAKNRRAHERMIAETHTLAKEILGLTPEEWGLAIHFLNRPEDFPGPPKKIKDIVRKLKQNLGWTPTPEF